MILPGAALIFIYHYIPMVGVAIAFQKFVPIRGITGSSWVGFDNFIFVLQLPDTLKVVANTLTIAVMKIVAGLVVPIGIALLLNEIGRTAFKRTVQTLIYLPHFLSWTILAGILIDVLSPSTGLVNQALKFIGLEPIFFLGDNRWFPFTLVISNEWKEFGFSTIVYLAALSSIDPSLYESAVIDGAGHWRRTWHVTLPGIRPIVVLLMTLSLGHILNAGFEQVFNLYSPIVYENGDIIDTMVYRMGLINAQYSFATAIGLMKALVSLILIAVSYMLAYRFADYRIF
ncbi:ABC transporter permease [Paenibacillus sp. HJGM_3]|uniref:ABC transporter permease n=1 Tax=Paenibacillus sp. HJGM_3 TaxID=3379816 RepID=UPI00385E6633